VVKQGAGTIPAKRLLDYVRLLPDADLTVRFQENQWASLVCGRSRTRIAGMSRESFPELPVMPAAVAELPIGLLASMIGRTIFAISAEESRFTLNGALIVLRPDTVTMVATDGHRLAMVENQESLLGISEPYRALLPKKAMSEILKLAQEVAAIERVRFAGDENHLFFQLGERLLISRKLTGNFPDFERVLPKEHANQVSIKREEFRASIERVSQFADERSRAIRLQIGPGEARVYSSLLETGESEESLPVSYDGAGVEIGFNAHYLLDFLRAVAEEDVRFYFKDAHSAGELRPGPDAVYSYRYVVMPMRI
jgi:DNA polymerase-3 subunit beta